MHVFSHSSVFLKRSLYTERHCLTRSSFSSSAVRYRRRRVCDGSGRLLRGVVRVRADRSGLVDFLRQENEAVTGRESVSLAMQGTQITHRL